MKRSSILLSIIVGAALVAYSTQRLSEIYKNKPPLESVRYVPRPSLLKAVSLEYRLLVADFFWMKVTLLYGEPYFRKKATPQDWDYIEKTVMLVTELDPYFFIPYYFAGIVLPMEANRYEAAIKILERGLKYLKTEWRIPFLIGFTYYYYLHDNLKAAEYFEMASKLPEAPEYLPKLAARLRFEAGEIRNAIAFLITIYNNTDNLVLKKSLARRIKALQDILYLTEAVNLYKKRFGHPPDSLKDLVRSGLIRAIPQEPYGGKYYYDKKEDKVKTTSNFRLIEKDAKKQN